MRDRQDTTAWQRHLAGTPLVRSILADRLPHLPGRSVEPLVCAVPLSAAARRELTGAGGEPATVLPLAALAALVLRYTGETDQIIGVLAGQLTVPRLRVRGSATLTEVRAAAAEAIGAAAAAGAVDGVELLRSIDCDGVTGAAPCHGVLSVRVDGPAGDELRYADVVVVLQMVRGEPKAALLGNPMRYERATVNRLARQFGLIIEALARGPGDRTVSAVSLLDAEERRRILLDWNDTATDIPSEHVHTVIAAHASTAPDSPAVVHAGVTTTFGQLDSGANRMANHLIALGVPPGGNVGVLMGRCANNLLAQLAIWKVGAAAVLLDPAYPPELLESMLSDSAPAAVITMARLAAALPGGPRCGAVVLVDSHATEWLAMPATDPRGPVEDDSIAHVAYAPAAGGPRAVRLRHGPLRDTAFVLRQECEMTPGSRGTWLGPPAGGLVGVDCLPVLAAGAAVHIHEPPVPPSAERLRDWLVDNEIVHTLQPTDMAERLWALAWPTDCALRSMRIAGDRVRAWPVPELPFTVLNMYGSDVLIATCDLTATAAALTTDERIARMPPIGRPVANTRAYVMDERTEPVPPGALGELCISRPGLTGATPYRTGDVCRYWPDGVIEIVGRLSGRAPLSACDVHLAEVECVLARAPGVRRCAVLVREDAPGRRRLVAYVEPHPAAPPRVDDLRAHLARRLPPFLLPRSYVVGRMPTTEGGAVDRSALAPPPPTRRPHKPYRAPATAVERRIGALLSEVFGIDRIGTEDDFAELGGDSLRAVRLLNCVRRTFGVRLAMADLLRAPTIGRLARVIERVVAGSGPHVIAHDAADRYRPSPLTTAQRLLWRAQGGRTGPADLYEWTTRRPDLDRYAEAWREVVRRHDALRTVVRAGGEQVVLRDGAAPQIVYLRALSPTRGDDQAGRAELRDASTPHTMRLTLRPDGSVRVQLAVSTLTVDPDSVHRVLLPELAMAYRDPDALPPQTITFRDYANRSVVLPPATDVDDTPGPGAADDTDVVTLSSALAPVVLRDLVDRCAAAAVTPQSAVVAILHDLLLDTDLGWLTGAARLPPLTYRTFQRPATDPPLDLLVGFFAVSRPVDLSDAGPTFADRARTVPDIVEGREPARCAVQITVTGGAPRPAEADQVDTIVSSGPFAVADVRVILDRAPRIHWSLPRAVDSTMAAALADRYRERLTRHASDDTPWWTTRRR